MNQKWLATIFFFALLLALLYLAFLILSPFLKAITWAALLAILAYPAYVRLLRIVRGRATLAALAVTLLILLVIVLPAFRIATFLSQEALEFAKNTSVFSADQGLGYLREWPSLAPLFRLWDSVSAALASFEIDLKRIMAQGAQVASHYVVAQVKDFAQDLLLFAVNFAFVLFSLFFFLRDGKDLCERIRLLLPVEPEHQSLLFERVVTAVFGVIHGIFITATVQGLLAGLAYWALGLPFAVLLGVATSFAALFPIGGSALIWLPASLYLFFQGAYMQGTMLLVWGTAVVAGIDNILRPILMGSRLHLSALFLFFSILGGVQLFGVLGLILGPVLFALLAALLDLYVKEYTNA